MVVTIRNYESFNEHRYGNPWAAPVLQNGRIDFSQKIGVYTGAYKKGEAGELYVIDPQEGHVYAYGQKDYRGNNGGYDYVVYQEGGFKHIDKSKLSTYLNRY